VWIDELVEGYQKDPMGKALLERLALKPEGVDGYVLKEGVIRNKGRIWIFFNPTLQTRVKLALHASVSGGHSGFHVTYSRVKQFFHGR
jgi:hypothetical protein